MSARLLPLSALLLATGLAGCGAVEWRKPGADEAALTQDLHSCQREAQVNISRLYGPPMPVQGPLVDPRYGAEPLRPTPADRMLQEQQAVERCMRGRGYTLVPAAAKAPTS